MVSCCYSSVTVIAVQGPLRALPALWGSKVSIAPRLPLVPSNLCAVSKQSLSSTRPLLHHCLLNSIHPASEAHSAASEAHSAASKAFQAAFETLLAAAS